MTLSAYFLFILTPRAFFPSFSMEQGHQPLTDCWANRDLACSVLCGALTSTSSIIVREHFSGVFAGATRLRRSSSSVPVITALYCSQALKWLSLGKSHTWNYFFVSLTEVSYRGNHPMRICHYPKSEQSALGESWTRLHQDSRSAPVS